MIDVQEIYTDGSCRGNPGPGSWGWIHFCNGQKISSKSGDASYTTNNQLELIAIYEALLYIQGAQKSGLMSIVTICTDSKYVYEGITVYISSWKKRGRKLANKRPVKNLEIWKDIDTLLLSGVTVAWKWVKGHADDGKNNAVDEMIRR